MPLLNRLERALGRFAIENLTLYLVIGQVFVFLMALLGRDLTGLIALQAGLVLKGQVWRLFSFVFEPQSLTNGAFGVTLTVFGWYLFYLMGSALEQFWGAFRYNLFLGLGWLLTVAVCFLFPDAYATAIFIGGGVFLAFAYLNPDFEMVIFFILPVKIKWLALLVWIGHAWLFFRGDWSVRFQIIAAVGNFLLFFGRDILQTMGWRRRQMRAEVRRFASVTSAPEARHRCYVCGKTDVSNPELDFRYCSKCAGDQCYCPEHIQNHAHVLASDDAPAR